MAIQFLLALTRTHLPIVFKTIVKRTAFARIIETLEKSDTNYKSDLKVIKAFQTNTITRLGKPEPKDRCIEWKIQTATNVKACKRYAPGDSKHPNS